jgi:hypothetical protein
MELKKHLKELLILKSRFSILRNGPSPFKEPTISLNAKTTKVNRKSSSVSRKLTAKKIKKSSSQSYNSVQKTSAI